MLHAAAGEFALMAGDLQQAKWAVRKGLAIVDGHESLYRMKMQAAAEAGDNDDIDTAYRESPTSS